MQSEDSPTVDTDDSSSTGSRAHTGAGDHGVVTVTSCGQRFTFEGCRQVWTDADARAIVVTANGLECRSTSPSVTGDAVPRNVGTHGYLAGDEEVVVGALPERSWQARHVFGNWVSDLAANPNSPAKTSFDSAEELRLALAERVSRGPRRNPRPLGAVRNAPTSGVQ